MNISARASANGRSGYRQTVIMSCAVFQMHLIYMLFVKLSLYLNTKSHFANVRACEGDGKFFFFCMVISEQLTIVVTLLFFNELIITTTSHLDI